MQVIRFRGNLVNGQYDGTLPQILGLVGLSLKVMVASGDRDPDVLELMGDKILGHVWKPTEDKFIFRILVKLSDAKRKTDQEVKIWTQEDIPKLLSLPLTKRMLLGFVMSQYDPMGLICPLLVKLKIMLRSLYGPDVDLTLF